MIAGSERGPRRKRWRRGRARAIARVLVWVLPVLAVLALAFGAIGWDPTVERRSGIDTSQLTQNEVDDVKAHKTFSSRGGADDYVRRLDKTIQARTPPSTTPAPPAST